MFELLRVAVRGAAAATLACAGAMLAATLLPVAFGWETQVVLTGSMRPGIAPGDLVVSAPVRAAQVRAGQVVVVEDPARPGTLLVHRVVRRNADGSLTTKGDANPSVDQAAVPAANVRGLARLRVPKVGLPALWLRQGRWAPVTAAFVVLIALGHLARERTRRGRHAYDPRRTDQCRPVGRTSRQLSRPDPHPGIRSDHHRATDLVRRGVL
ncbi:signal peptidase I [Dactylosporangium siamense]|uniref:Signal peptidase I n=1 Tax=Dactylosporangium siamense TaxID=685454 RepID=A0A919U8X7_9ACTN|nr:signal peptidase I [Dactylosporangium siamense]GIG46197.1 hypothetical protein Dsi01nite_042380 [Dactylosporangium siamense]